MLTLREVAAWVEEPEPYLRHFGSDEMVLRAKQTLARRVFDTFEENFPSSPRREVAVTFVPGRVEVLGKHTDYAGGHSLLMAVDRGFIALSALNEEGCIRMVEDDPAYGSCEFEFRPDLEPPLGHWSNYPMTMAKRLAANFGREHPWRGVDIAFGCDLPVGGGMSGSSAFMIMTFFALALPNRLWENEKFRRNIRNNLDLAMYLACAENGQTFRELEGSKGVGTFGGSEDHTEILNARPGMFSLFEFCPTVHKADLSVPPEWVVVIGYSGVRAEKTRAALEKYNLVSRRARLAVEAYNRRYGTNFTLLRELGGEPAEQVEAALEAADREQPTLKLRARYRQFAAENWEIIPAVAQALLMRDEAALGALIDRSHELSRECLGNIVPEIDFLQRKAREWGALAASGFGAGFGGSLYAIVEQSQAEEFCERWQQAYQEQFPAARTQAYFFSTRPAGSACELFVPP
ncbi:MAG TPA: galactokinase [Armatimonadetes bacterium]|nr:galactokinase [Armatimonadota bacterium]